MSVVPVAEDLKLGAGLADVDGQCDVAGVAGPDLRPGRPVVRGQRALRRTRLLLRGQPQTPVVLTGEHGDASVPADHGGRAARPCAGQSLPLAPGSAVGRFLDPVPHVPVRAPDEEFETSVGVSLHKALGVRRGAAVRVVVRDDRRNACDGRVRRSTEVAPRRPAAIGVLPLDPQVAVGAPYEHGRPLVEVMGGCRVARRSASGAGPGAPAVVLLVVHPPVQGVVRAAGEKGRLPVGRGGHHRGPSGRRGRGRDGLWRGGGAGNSRGR